MNFSVPFNYAVQNIILLFFVFNLLIGATVLLFRAIKYDLRPEAWLSILLFLCALYITPWMLGHAGWYTKPIYRDILFYLPLHQYFLFGPIMLFLTLSLTQRDWHLRKRDWIHFLPALLYLLYSLLIAIGDVLIWKTYYFYADEMDKDFAPWYQILGLSCMVAYAWICVLKYQAYKKHIYANQSNADSIRLQWLKTFLLALILIIVLRAVFIVIFPAIGDWGFKWWYYLAFSGISCYLGLSGYTHSIRLNNLQFVLPISITPLPEKPASISPLEQRQYFAKVQQLMEEHHYFQDPNLTLPQLAQYANTNTSILSRVINQQAGMNFNDYINSFRITAVKQALRENKQTLKTIEGLALEAGFNSKSTFLRAFKKSEGMTPSQYKRSL
ncbi:MAG: AraC family transcriptional regulator [Saprospiraceae bacterium]|nr:AraC family transcriptional regulator [Saprospiraceae bacterium]